MEKLGDILKMNQIQTTIAELRAVAINCREATQTQGLDAAVVELISLRAAFALQDLVVINQKQEQENIRLNTQVAELNKQVGMLLAENERMRDQLKIMDDRYGT